MLKRLKWNKKRIIGVLFVTVVAALTLGLGVYNRMHYLPESYEQVTGTYVNNDYNNYISESDLVNATGDFVRIGDKLYYNYYGSYATYGLYEIAPDGAQRIHWDGYGPWAFLIGHSYKLYPIREYSGKLLMNTVVDSNYYVYQSNMKEWELAQGELQTYCAESQTFYETVLFGNSLDISALTYQETSFGFVYESSERFDLWVYSTEGGSERISSENVISFYTVENQIYYLTHAISNDPYVLHAFDWGSKTDTVICQWEDYTNIMYFIVEDNYLIFVAQRPDQNTQSVYTFDLRNPTQMETPIYTIDRGISDALYIYSWNVSDGIVYLCTQTGLIALDMYSGTHRVLCDKMILECDIVDDTWVYFIEKDSHNLWRVSKSGEDVELVFGK